MTELSLESLVASYGYLAVFVGTFLEGETILVVAGFLAHRGYLELPFVILSAMLGTLAGDQLFYFLGRIKGMAWLESRPRWKAASERVIGMLARHQVPVILGFRFLYGLRTVTPFLIGASGVPPLRFAALNVAGALLWAACIGIAGYLLGHVLELVLEEVKRYELWVLGGIAVAGAAAWVAAWWRTR